MKIYLTALLAFLITPALVFATLDVTMSESSIISVGGYSLVVSGTANFDSIEVSASSFSVQLSPAATLKVTSADRKAFTVSHTQYITAVTCTASESSVTIAMAAGGTATNVTITPSSGTCASTSNSGGTSIRTVASSSKSSDVATPPVNPATLTTNLPSVSSSASLVFNKNLARGSKGEDVRNLQRILAQDKAVYPEGLVSGFFGLITERAVKKFQAKYSLPQVGAVGPITRQMLQIVAIVNNSSTIMSPAQISTTTSHSANSSQSSSVSTEIINGNLQKGMKGEQVSKLQRWISKDKEIYPDAIISGYFGSLTEKAVQKFQQKYGIVGPGEEGYGFVGQKTRVKLSEIFGGSSSLIQ